jgi:hypothetical protein
MNEDFRHLFLKNAPGFNEGFKKTRNIKTDSKVDSNEEVSKLPSPIQQTTLKKNHRLFIKEREERLRKRSIDVPSEIEYIEIHFFKVFNNELRNLFYSKYGLTIEILEEFNKTVFFEISDTKLFYKFLHDLEDFYNSSPKKSYKGERYNLIPLIHNFSFFSSYNRLKSFDNGLLSFSLMPVHNKLGELLYNALVDKVKSYNKSLSLSNLNPYFFEVDGLSKAETFLLVDNYDNIKSVTSSHIERRKSGIYGQEIRDYGFTVSSSENLPIIGIIDSGVHRIEPLTDFITTINIDLTNTSANWDSCGHGTAVAGMVVLGQDFLKNNKATYEAHAKIAVIKAIHNDNDSININKIIDSIIKANEEYGIKIFNMSLNDPLPKGYNSSFSEFAYLLDKVAYEKDIIVFLSVGNILENRLNELINEEPDPLHSYPVIFYSPDKQSAIHSCESTNISSPSESLNNISVGALAGNFEKGNNTGITPAKELPAYYTRKFHYDYNQKVNGSKFSRSQKNKHLNKPDLVFEGGDLFSDEASMEILCPPVGDFSKKYFSRSCGTSLATPLITSLAAEILTNYPTLKPQTVKALLINSAASPCGKAPIFFQNFEIDILRKLIGFGKPGNANLIFNNNNSVTFILENEIELDELQTIKIAIPRYLNSSANKINFRATLCYSFQPVKDNHLNYLPLQITFGFFKPIEADIMSKSSTKDYRIKQTISWSEDFFGVENRLFSNVQKLDFNVSGETIESLGNQLSLAIKCTGKKEIPENAFNYLKNTKHKFSLAFTISETPLIRAQSRLYHEIVAINNVEAIASAGIDLTLENG